LVVARLIAILLLLAIGLALVLYLFTRNRRFLSIAWRLFQFGVVIAIIFMALFVVERLIMLV
jgi:hypothetical protein